MPKVLTVGNCTAEEWREFWQARGWSRFFLAEWTLTREVNSEHSEGVEFYVNRGTDPLKLAAWVGVHDSGCRDYPADVQLQQIADELDELANTKIMGGWRK